MMNLKRIHLLVTALSAGLFLAACSSSDNKNPTTQNPTDQTQSTPAAGDFPVTPATLPEPSTVIPANPTTVTPPANVGSVIPGTTPIVTPADPLADKPSIDVPENPNNVVANPPANNVVTTPNTGSSASLVDLRTVNNDILRSLAGYELETLSEEIGLLVDTVVTTATTSITLPEGSAQVSNQSGIQTYPVARARYECPQGGTLTTATLSEGEFSAGSGSFSETNNATYLFEQCVLNGTNGHTLNGTTTVNSSAQSANRTNIRNNTFSWTNFQWLQPSGQTLNIEANVAINSNNALELDDEKRVASIQQFTRRVGAVETSGIRDATFTLSQRSDSSVSEFSLETAGKITDPTGAVITVLADPALGRKFYKGASASTANEPFNGQITYSSSDGSSLQMVANGADASGNRLTDNTYIDVNGASSTLTNQRFTDLEINGN